MINYTLATEYADVVRAIFMIESNEDLMAVGDGGRALGPGQQHPAFFKQYYGCHKDYPASVADTWADAWVKATAAYFATWSGTIELDLLVQGYNKGLDGVLRDGQRAPDYLRRFTDALNKIHAEANKKCS